jgi:hypothetical protein
MIKIVNVIVLLFGKIAEQYETKETNKLLSNCLVLVFVMMLSFALADTLGILPKSRFFGHLTFFSSITVTFNALLFFEIVGLVFIIPNSIANSIGKQYEILSLTLLRSSFEEFAHFEFKQDFFNQLPAVYKMCSDGFSAVIIFGLVHVFYSFQKHRQITQQLNEKEEFVKTKKVIAFFVLIAFIIIAGRDAFYFIQTGVLVQSVQLFYMTLILADMLFMLIALRYVIHYPNVFRYSAFVLITIFIRFSLLAPVYYNGLIGVGTVVFGIVIVYLHNRFFDGNYFETKKTVKI